MAETGPTNFFDYVDVVSDLDFAAWEASLTDPEYAAHTQAAAELIRAVHPAWAAFDVWSRDMPLGEYLHRITFVNLCDHHPGRS